MKRTLAVLAALALAGGAFAAPPAGPELAKEVPGESRFTLTEASRVSFGIGSVFTERMLVPGNYPCDHTTFGLTNGPGVVRRACSLTLAPGAAPATYSYVATEGKTFTLSTASDVRFGINGRWTSQTLPAGTHSCNLAIFKNVDPWVGVLKSCERVNAATTSPTTPTPTPPVVIAPPPVPKPDPITPVTPVASDVSTPEQYRAVAATLGTDAWIAYKFGAAPTGALTGTTYPGPRPSFSMGDLSGQHNPLKVFPDGVKGGRACGVGPDAWCGTYQIGSLIGAPGDYSSNIINVAYLPDATPPAGFQQPKYFGVASLQTLNVGHGTVSIKPESSWTTDYGPWNNNADNDENTRRFAGVHPDGLRIGTIPMDKPVAAARGFGRGGWTNNTLTVLANGWVIPSGSNTSHNLSKAQVPASCKPTAIAITNSGEFALVPCWDVTALKGRVAVMALADGCQWCDPGTLPDESKWGANWGSARQAYPGMPGLGNYVGIKFVGFVDLPDDMKAPTEIAVTTGKPKGGHFGYQRIQNFFDAHMLTAANRAMYFTGDWRGAIARTGMAVVVSKSEKKAAYIDLRPLFEYYREQYVGPQTDAQWQAKIAARGPGDNQFPQGFTSAPQQKPAVIKVVDLDSKPTAVRMMPNAPHRALLATEDGKLRIVTLGDRYLDQDAAKVGAPTDIGELSSINVGANPTSIAHMDEKARLDNGRSYLWGDDTPEEFFWWTLSRAERKATLLRMNAGGTGFSVFKTLQDSRMVDPIAIYDGANHGTESHMLTVLGHFNKSVSTYLYGPIVMHTFPQSGQWAAPCTRSAPCAPLGGQPFEYGGEHKLPGKPFQGGLANIN